MKRMKTPNNSLLSLSFFLFLISWVNSTNTHDNFLNCLQSHNSISNSEIIYTQQNTTFESILQSSIRNLRPTSESPLKPRVIVTPLHESQIQATIYCSKINDLQIRVRSGGHDYEGLSYISEIPFVIIDLKNLRSVTIDSEMETAWVGVGATLGEFYHTLAQKSRTLAFVAGVCPTVGVGGHFSGGGYSMMSRAFGLAADHIIDARIIDVNGRILDRKSMGEDLFWAIRGGGGASFGVIIAYRVELLTLPENVTVFNVTKTLDQNATQLVHRWQYIADKIDENLLIRLFISSVSSSQSDNKRTIHVSFTSLFVGGADDLLEIMNQSFPELGLVKEDCIEMSWIESILFFASFPRDESIDVLLNRTASNISYFKGKSDYVTRPISENGLKGIWERLNEQDEDRAQLQFSPYGGRIAEVSEYETPFPHRAGNIFMIHYGVGWAEEEKSQASKYINWIRSLYSYMAQYVSKSPRGAYMNYRDLDLGENNIGNTSYKQASKWGLRYFKNNFNRLVQVKTKVDPGNFFRNEQSIPSLAN